MKFLGNLVWFFFTGLLSWVSWSLAGILWCITVIGIPFGVQCFKIAKLIVWPIGHTVTTDFPSHPVANLIWALLFGWEFCVGYTLSGILYYITVIGIPFGRQCFKLAALSIFPFGAKIR